MEGVMVPWMGYWQEWMVGLLGCEMVEELVLVDSRQGVLFGLPVWFLWGFSSS